MLHPCCYGFLNSEVLQQKSTDKGSKNNKNCGTMRTQERIRLRLLSRAGREEGKNTRGETQKRSVKLIWAVKKIRNDDSPL